MIIQLKKANPAQRLREAALKTSVGLTFQWLYRKFENTVCHTITRRLVACSFSGVTALSRTHQEQASSMDVSTKCPSRKNSRARSSALDAISRLATCLSVAVLFSLQASPASSQPATGYPLVVDMAWEGKKRIDTALKAGLKMGEAGILSEKSGSACIWLFTYAKQAGMDPIELYYLLDKLYDEVIHTLSEVEDGVSVPLNEFAPPAADDDLENVVIRLSQYLMNSWEPIPGLPSKHFFDVTPRGVLQQHRDIGYKSVRRGITMKALFASLIGDKPIMYVGKHSGTGMNFKYLIGNKPADSNESARVLIHENYSYCPDHPGLAQLAPGGALIFNPGTTFMQIEPNFFTALNQQGDMTDFSSCLVDQPATPEVLLYGVGSIVDDETELPCVEGSACFGVASETPAITGSSPARNLAGLLKRKYRDEHQALFAEGIRGRYKHLFSKSLSGRLKPLSEGFSGAFDRLGDDEFLQELKRINLLLDLPPGSHDTVATLERLSDVLDILKTRQPDHPVVPKLTSAMEYLLSQHETHSTTTHENNQELYQYYLEHHKPAELKRVNQLLALDYNWREHQKDLQKIRAFLEPGKTGELNPAKDTTGMIRKLKTYLAAFAHNVAHNGPEATAEETARLEATLNYLQKVKSYHVTRAEIASGFHVENNFHHEKATRFINEHMEIISSQLAGLTLDASAMAVTYRGLSDFLGFSVESGSGSGSVYRRLELMKDILMAAEAYGPDHSATAKASEAMYIVLASSKRHYANSEKSFDAYLSTYGDYEIQYIQSELGQAFNYSQAEAELERLGKLFHVSGKPEEVAGLANQVSKYQQILGTLPNIQTKETIAGHLEGTLGVLSAYQTMVQGQDTFVTSTQEDELVAYVKRNYRFEVPKALTELEAGFSYAQHLEGLKRIQRFLHLPERAGTDFSLIKPRLKAYNKGLDQVEQTEDVRQVQERIRQARTFIANLEGYLSGLQQVGVDTSTDDFEQFVSSNITVYAELMSHHLKTEYHSDDLITLMKTLASSLAVPDMRPAYFELAKSRLESIGKMLAHQSDQQIKTTIAPLVPVLIEKLTQEMIDKEILKARARDYCNRSNQRFSDDLNIRGQFFKEFLDEERDRINKIMTDPLNSDSDYDTAMKQISNAVVLGYMPETPTIQIEKIEQRLTRLRDAFKAEGLEPETRKVQVALDYLAMDKQYDEEVLKLGAYSDEKFNAFFKRHFRREAERASDQLFGMGFRESLKDKLKDISAFFQTPFSSPTGLAQLQAKLSKYEEVFSAYPELNCQSAEEQMKLAREVIQEAQEIAARHGPINTAEILQEKIQANKDREALRVREILLDKYLDEEDPKRADAAVVHYHTGRKSINKLLQLKEGATDISVAMGLLRKYSLAFHPDKNREPGQSYGVENRKVTEALSFLRIMKKDRGSY
ncbi:MAG: hypothetical protein ACR2PT_04055 [Endozoicomonas sp.]